MRVTYIIILINIIVFIAQIAIPPFTNVFALDPQMALNGAYWQFVTYMFLHAFEDIHGNLYLTHIAINLFVLLIFGAVVEREIGRDSYIALYILSGIGSAFLHLGLTTLQMGFLGDIGLIGASGAVFGVIAVYGLLFPKNWIIIFPGIPMPAIVAVIAIAGFELISGIIGLFPGIASFGHLGGIIVGIFFIVYWKYIKKQKKAYHGDFEFLWR